MPPTTPCCYCWNSPNHTTQHCFILFIFLNQLFFLCEKRNLISEFLKCCGWGQLLSALFSSLNLSKGMGIFSGEVTLPLMPSLLIKFSLNEISLLLRKQFSFFWDQIISFFSRALYICAGSYLLCEKGPKTAKCKLSGPSIGFKLFYDKSQGNIYLWTLKHTNFMGFAFL